MTHAYGLPENPTPQSIFDKVATHLFEQGRPALNGNSCAYRGEEGRVCAIGCLITDEQYDRRMESKAGYAVLRDHPLQDLRPFDELLDELQVVHDRPAHRNEDGTFDLEILSAKLLGVAEKHGLKPYAALRITEAEFDALLKAREILAQPELPAGYSFNMRTWARFEHECGTACCIGGTMGLLMADAFDVVIAGGTAVDDLPREQRLVVRGINKHGPQSDAFDPLFFPGRGGGNPEAHWDKYTAAQGVQAIDEFLAGKRQPWAFSNV